jgi:hypothetical protein
MVYTVCAIDLFFPSISFPSFICFGDNGLWRIIVRKKSECALVSSRSGRYGKYTRTRTGLGGRMIEDDHVLDFVYRTGSRKISRFFLVLFEGNRETRGREFVAHATSPSLGDGRQPANDFTCPPPPPSSSQIKKTTTITTAASIAQSVRLAFPPNVLLWAFVKFPTPTQPAGKSWDPTISQ